MKILVVCQHYWPEPFNTSDVCEELVKGGTVFLLSPACLIPECLTLIFPKSIKVDINKLNIITA